MSTTWHPACTSYLWLPPTCLDDPLPSNLELEFTIPETFVNHAPSPQDDDAIITMIEGTGPETLIEVLLNDFDIDGQPIELPADAIEAYPNQGSIVRLDPSHVVYKPFQWASGLDSFATGWWTISEPLGSRRFRSYSWNP